MRIKNAVKQLIAQRLDDQYDKKLSVKKVDYDTWIREQEQSSFVPDGTDTRPGEFILFVQKTGRLSDNAAKRIQAYFAGHEECLILYGDEDMMRENGVRENPWYKPCWSPDLYLDSFYFGSVIAVRRKLAEKILSGEEMTDDRIWFDSAADIRDRMDALAVAAGGFERNSHSIDRLPGILFHAADMSLWESYMETPSERLPVRDGKDDGEVVSVIIPSKDNPEILKKCLDSLKTCGEWQKLDVIVVDNGSSAQNRKILEGLTKDVSYVYHPMEFNFSAMCNLGKQKARGRLLLFLNDDVEVCGNEWLERMRQKALQPYVGAVGLKLLYPDGVRIQHAGITNLPVGPVHKMQFFEDSADYYFGRNRYDHNCLAVTAACLMIDRDKLQETGGFNEKLKVAYNDVELGFCLWELGYQNVVINHCHAIHHESLSRGSDETWERLKRLEGERELLYSLHPELCGKDPYYPKQLNIEGLDSRILPGYVTSRNTLQPPSWRRPSPKTAGYREDACLMVRVETAGPEKIQGYCVVLGDDNACYERYLLLGSGPDGGSEQPPELLFCMKLEGQYRDDLEQNLPDQKNVALGGFRVSRTGEKIASGIYRIGVLAVHRISGLKLLGWSGKCLRVSEQE